MTQTTRQRSIGREVSRSRSAVVDEPVAVPVLGGDAKISNRLNVLDELLNTERDYLRDLTTVVNQYLQPLRQSKLLSSEAIAKIFVNIESIRELHSEIYLDLEEKISDIRLVSSIEQCISEIFAKNTERLRNYVTFSIGYKGGIIELKSQIAKSSAFAQFLQEAQASDPKNLRLSDYLIKPIQRLCKYPLIFREILKSTPPDHKDRAFMEETMHSLERLTDHVNECNQQAENEAKLQAVADTLVGLDLNLVVPGRVLLKHACQWVSKEKERLKRRYIVVCNDMLILCKPKTKKQFQVMSIIESQHLLYSSAPSVTVSRQESPSASPISRSGSRLSFKRSAASVGSGGGLIPDNPGLCFQIINLVTKEKFNVQVVTEADKKEWETVMGKCASNTGQASLSMEEDLDRERKARKSLQEKNGELWKRIKQLEMQLEEEKSLRRSLEEKLKTKP